MEDVALTSDSFVGDQVVTRHHSNCNTGFVALGNSPRYFGSDNVLNTDDGDERLATFLDIVEVIAFTDVAVVGAALIRLKVTVSEGDGSQGLCRIGGDDVEEPLLDIIIQGGLETLLIEVVST